MKSIKIVISLLLFFSILSFPPQSKVEAMKPNYKAIAVGNHHFLAIDCNGDVWAWGRNTFGQLGYSHSGAPNISSNTPMRVRSETGATLRNIVAVAAGSGHSVALDDQGQVWTWGHNLRGELGHSPAGTNSTNPMRVPIEANIVAVDAGLNHTMALDSLGRVWVWGDDSFGQSAGNFAPAPIGSLTNVIAISAGGDHSVALRSDGTVWAWGRGTFGQLGNGQTIHQNYTPQQVSRVNDVIAIAAGNYHTLIVREDTRVWGFGLNEYGQLGDISHAQYLTPTQIPNLNDVISVEAGDFHSVALKKDGSAYVWGRNSNQPMAHRATPVQIEHFTNGVAIATGGDATIQEGGPYVLAVKSDGSLWSWDMRTVDPNSLRPFFNRHQGIDCITVSSQYPFVQGNQVLFRYEGAANKVEVKGQFNQDFIEIPLIKVKENIWEIQLEIPPGTYYYGFSVDGVWRNDPYNSERERLPSGTFNILRVPHYEPASPIVNGKNVLFTYSSYDVRGVLERTAKTQRVALQYSDGRQVEMKKGSNNIWSVTQQLPIGTHYYNFVVEDQYTSFQEEKLDPLNSEVNVHSFTKTTYNIVTIQDETMITVPVQSIAIQGSNPMNLTAGEETFLNYNIQPATATNKQVNWSSSNPSVVSVNSHGKLTAYEPGTAIITVTTVDGGFIAHKNIEVTGQPGLVQYPRPGYKDFGSRSDIDYQKSWEIRFSNPVMTNTIHENIYILDSNNQKVDVIPQLDRNDNHVVVMRRLESFSFRPGATYYLVIEEGVTDTEGKALSEPAIMQFSIKW